MSSLADRDYDFPPELLEQPKALVGVVGLDTSNNAVHRATWDALRSDRRVPESSSVRFKLLQVDHEYPRPKPNKASFELHIPKGILKRNWMHKHLTQVPAVVGVFYDLEWDDPRWEEKKEDCAARVQVVRQALEGHATRVCVVLMQKSAPSPSSDESLAVDKARQIFQAAGLTNKCLFVLPNGEHLLGWTSKLEKALNDLAFHHYQSKISQIQAHKENLNKKMHQFLYVRHHFKMGFFSELERDFSTARKYYREAYNSLLEVRLSDTNEFEVKTVAGFIGYKISRVEFLLNKWDDAISHFKAHIEHYKHITGSKELLFQHHAWLAKQYSMFADLFEEMVHLGKPATQIRHPGYYNKLAAKQAEERKLSAQLLCANVQSYPSPDPLAGWEDLEFYGQRPWRPCKRSAELLDPELERQGILALQFNEKMVDHSNIIIALLGTAISQFKTYRCPKMRQNLVIQMAEEYYQSKDYGKALTLLMHTFWDYRIEKWFLIVEKLMVIAMASAYLTASITEYARLCLDVISRPGNINAPRALNNLILLTTGGIPEPEPNLDPNEVENALKLWSCAKSEEIILVDTSVFTCPVQCKAVIVKHEYDSVQINIILRSDIPQSFTFSKLTVTVLGGTGQHVDHIVASRLHFDSGEVKTYTCSFVPNIQDIGKPLQVATVLLNIGEIEGKTIGLKFNGFGRDSTSFHSELLYFKQTKGSGGDFLKIKPQLTCTVSRRIAKVQAEVNHNPPALLNEWYPLKVRIWNNESSPVTSSDLIVSFPTNYEKEIIHTSNFRDAGNANLITLPYSLELGDLSQSSEKCFYIKCGTLISRTLEIKLNYNVDGHLCVVESQIDFDVVEPFRINTKYMSTKFEELPELYTREPFLIQPQITSLSPWPITIHSTSIHLSEAMEFEGSYECLLVGCELEFENTASELACASAKKFSNEPVLVASFSVEWARSGESMTSSVTCVLPKMKIVDIPISVTVDAPATGVFKSQYTAKYYITNHSSKLHILQLSVEASNEFTFAGINKMHLFLLPESTKELEYQMYPLCCGTASLPNLKLNAMKDDHIPNLERVVLRALPANIFIMPEGKESQDLQSPAMT